MTASRPVSHIFSDDIGIVGAMEKFVNKMLLALASGSPRAAGRIAGFSAARINGSGFTA